MSLFLRLKPGLFDRPIPVDAASLSPDRLAGLTARQVGHLPLVVGARTERAGDLFDIEGRVGAEVTIEGDLQAFSRIGAFMSRGRLTIRGHVGPRAGSGMRGGALRIQGSVAAHAGEGMRGGALVVDGSAGAFLGAPLLGEPHGLQGGVLLVRGNAGRMAGFRMRRGTMVVLGDAGPGAGTAMIAGSLFAFGRLGRGAGALMRRGTIVALAPHDPLPVFLDAGRSRAPWLRLYYDALTRAGIALPPVARDGVYTRHVGDVSGGGRGEILVLDAT